MYIICILYLADMYNKKKQKCFFGSEKTGGQVGWHVLFWSLFNDFPRIEVKSCQKYFPAWLAWIFGKICCIIVSILSI